MTIQLYSSLNSVVKKFVDNLIPKGITVYRTEILEAMLERIFDTKADIAIFDVTQEDVTKILNIISTIRKTMIENNTKFGIIIYGTIDPVNSQKAIELGVNAFIKSDFPEENLADFLQNLYENLMGAPPQRKFIRVSLNPNKQDERLLLRFRLPHSSILYMAVIKDISFGGLAAELISNQALNQLYKGLVIENMQFTIKDIDIYLDGEIVAYNNRLIAFKFTYMSKQDKDNLCEFISKKISTT